MAGQGKLATEVRTGLSVVNGGKTVNNSAASSYLDERQFGKPIRQHVKEFGEIFAILFLGIAALRLYKGSSFTPSLVLSLLGVVMYLLGRTAPQLLHPVWKGWMAFAHVLGTVMTTVILTIAWYLTLLPLALILKSFKIKVMQTTFREPVTTYWEEREARLNDFKLLERQF